MEASEPLAPAEPWWNQSFMVTFAFKCNLACTFCMVEDALEVFEGTSVESFRRFAEDPRALGGATRIIFSGGEVTLAKALLEYVEIARDLPSIEHVRIQTNAVRLGNAAYLKTLIDAGVDEYFVSLHAPDAALHDAIAQRSGAFEGILRGLGAIRDAGATLITNTAIVETNYRALPQIVELAASFGPRSVELWNYWPRGDEAGARGLAAPIGEVRGPLLEALGVAVARRIPPVVKWFPRCLLGDFAWCQDDGQPPALIEEGYWDREPGYGCLYEGVCAESMGRPPSRAGGAGKCAGLSDTYVHRFGWEEALLRPVRAGTRPKDRRFTPAVARSLTRDAGPRRVAQARAAAWLAGVGLPAGCMVAGFELVGAERVRDALVVAFASGEGRVSVTIRASGEVAAQAADEGMVGRATALACAVEAHLAARRSENSLTPDI